MIEKDIISTLRDTIACGSPNLKLMDLLPLKCSTLGDNANKIPTKQIGKNIPSINEYGINFDTSFAFPFDKRSKFKAIIAELILDA